MKNFIILFATLLFPFSLFAQTNWYVSMDGDDSDNGTSPTTPFRTFNKVSSSAEAGDAILIMGTYTNDSYDEDYSFSGNINDAHIWHQEHSVRINGLNGTASNYITIKPYNDDTVIKGDGANLFRVTNSSYLRVEDLELYGEVENIPIETAKDLQWLYRESGSTTTLRRVPEGTTLADIEENYSNDGDLPKLNDVSRPSYTDTRGFYFSGVHHIDIIGNTVHHTPGNGFRVADCDYINIIGNKVYATSRKSYSGTHGMVISGANSEVQGFADTNDGHKIFILKNTVYENYNEIVSWSPQKTKITPHIDEGKGISLQKNDIDDNNTPDNLDDDKGWLRGRFLVANNITYKNGFSGLHVNKCLRVDFINNTSYLNSYTKSIYEPTTGNGGNIGISSQSSDDIKIINNISVIDTNLNKSAIAAANSTNLVVDSNVIYGSTFAGVTGTIQEDDVVVDVQTNDIKDDPLFVDPTNNDFTLQFNSPAKNAANTTNAPDEDYFGNARDANPDIGATEYISTGGITYSFDGSWAPSNPSGVSTDEDIINIASGNATNSSNNISGNTQAKTLIVAEGAKLVVNVDGSLILENFDNEGDITIRSNSSTFGNLIVTNVVNTGTINYRRYVNANATSGGNDLIAAPLHGETVGDFADFQSNEDVILSSATNPSKRLFGPFDKATSSYLSYDTDTADADIELTAGVGYRCGTVATSNNTVVFKGNLEVGTVNVPIEDSGSAFSKWNLIGNPYTSNVDFEAFFNENKDQLDSDLYQSIYGYNATANNWTIWNQLTIDDTKETELIVPGQGFFVASKSANEIIVFTPDMRRGGESDDFITTNRSTASPKIALAKLNLKKGGNQFKTSIYFVEDKTRGIDAGYDAAAFNGSSDGIFTHLVEDNTGVAIAIQALPYQDFNDIIVPLGVKVSAGHQFTIGLDGLDTDLPEDTLVYLEDRTSNAWTLLNDGDYIGNANSDISGVGRYYIHFKATVLSISENEFEDINIYVSKNTLHVSGQLNDAATLEIYDTLGRKAFVQNLDKNTNANRAELAKLSTGIYIVHLKSATQAKVQKIILN